MLFADPLQGSHVDRAQARRAFPRAIRTNRAACWLGKPGLADELFRSAGFKDVAATEIDAPFKPASTQDYRSFIRTSASPIQHILGRLDAIAANAAWSEIAERLSLFETVNGWEGPTSCY